MKDKIELAFLHAAVTIQLAKNIITVNFEPLIFTELQHYYSTMNEFKWVSLAKAWFKVVVRSANNPEAILVSLLIPTMYYMAI